VIGIETEVIESSPDKITMKVSSCPVYQGAAAIGMESAGIEEGCLFGAMPYMTALAKQLNPKLKVQLAKFREGAEKCCIEEIVLES
jgi:hypothetical protein